MNLFCWIPLEHDATSFYRALQPISQLRKIMPKLNIFHAPKEINMVHIAHMDVIFLQRPSCEAQLQLMQMAKRLGISTQAYQRMERPGRSNLTVATLDRVASAIGKKLLIEAV